MSELPPAPPPKPEPLDAATLPREEVWFISRQCWRWYFWTHVLVVVGSCMVGQVETGHRVYSEEVSGTLNFIGSPIAMLGLPFMWIGPIVAIVWLCQSVYRGELTPFLHAGVALFLTYVQLTAMLPLVQ